MAIHGVVGPQMPKNARVRALTGEPLFKRLILCNQCRCTARIGSGKGTRLRSGRPTRPRFARTRLFFGGNRLKPLAIRRDIVPWVLRTSLDRDSILQAVRLEADAIVASMRFASTWMLLSPILLIRPGSVFAQPLHPPGIPHNRASSSSSSLLAQTPVLPQLPVRSGLVPPDSLSACPRSPGSCLFASCHRSQAAFA